MAEFETLSPRESEQDPARQSTSESSEQLERIVKLIKKSKLRVIGDVNQFPMVYHVGYDISLMGLEKVHPFDAGKWGRVITFLKNDGLLRTNLAESIVTPVEASSDDLKIVHTDGYLNGLKWSAKVAAIMEVPCVACVPNFIVQRYALRRFRLQTGGTVAAAHLAMDHGSAINIGGGFHHCSADQGGGFCAYADITLAIRMLLATGRCQRAMIVDLDAHQGNGHERDFMDERRVFIMDMYNAQIYPHDTHAKRGISRKIELKSGCSTERYLSLLRTALPECLDEFQPEFVLYNAGTDCLAGDPLGRMDISAEGIVERDECVFSECANRSIPVCMVTSGGYQMNNARIIADSIINLNKKQLMTVISQ